MQNLSGVVDHYYLLSPLSGDVEIEEVFIVGSCFPLTNKLLLRLLLFLINYATSLIFFLLSRQKFLSLRVIFISSNC